MVLNSGHYFYFIATFCAFHKCSELRNLRFEKNKNEASATSKVHGDLYSLLPTCHLFESFALYGKESMRKYKSQCALPA